MNNNFINDVLDAKMIEQGVFEQNIVEFDLVSTLDYIKDIFVN